MASQFVRRDDTRSVDAVNAEFQTHAYRKMGLVDVQISDAQRRTPDSAALLRLDASGKRGVLQIRTNAQIQTWKAIHTFAPQQLNCEGRKSIATKPSEVRAWALEGLNALAVAVDFYGAASGCSLTRWQVIPVKPMKRRVE